MGGNNGEENMATRRLIGHIDANGEIHEGAVLALVVPKRKNGFDEGWVAVAQNAYLALANSGLGLDARRVLDILLARLDFENWIHLPQAEIAKILNMQRSHVSRAMRDLEKVGVILRGPKVGRSITYRINPHFGWKGSAKNHNAALNEDLKERMRERGLSVVPTEEPVAG
jgi:predicted transcriptional regulator